MRFWLRKYENCCLLRGDAVKSGRIYLISFCPSNCVNILVFYQITWCHFPNTPILNQAGLEVGHRIGMKEEDVYLFWEPE
jgi:hypothetical protein